MAGRLIEHPFPSSGKLLRNLYKLIGPAPVGSLVVRTRHGFMMQVNPHRNKGVDASIYFNGTYEAGTIHTIQRILRPGDVFFDVGANIGLMTLAAAQVVGAHGQVHAFEPVRSIGDILRANVSLNDFRQVTVHDEALGESSEQRWIYEQPSINAGSASFVATRNGLSEHKVPVLRLDDFVERAQIDSIRMIKIDVEGWEINVLKGARDVLTGDRAPALCVEYTSYHDQAAGTLTDLYDYITSVNRYRCFKLRYGKETISRLVPILSRADLPRHDNIFCFMPEQLEGLEAVSI